MEHKVEKKRHLAKAVFVFLADIVIKFVLYYMHERLWYERITYGVKKDV